MNEFIAAIRSFPVRPWVRRAGLSIVCVAVAVTILIGGAATVVPSVRFGWMREPFVWVYIGTLWLGGLKVFTGALRPIAETGPDGLVLRPLHQFFTKRVAWSTLRGTEQSVGGDRLIVYYDTPRGLRFVAMNLNLIKGRRDFLALLDSQLRAMGFVEKVVERSRYMSKSNDEG